MPPELENRILSLAWPQFVNLVAVLSLAPGVFSDTWTPAMRVSDGRHDAARHGPFASRSKPLPSDSS